uniref:UV excision repair protein RAD23 n=1 Tax=Lingulaulax polyedra TaxID=160621 RepID=A0A516AG03_LINPO|nr:UV excision repair protein RAD23 [Lingulodinium polyedra]
MVSLTVRPLRSEAFEVQAELEAPVAALKAAIAAQRPELPAAQQKLVYSGRILADDVPLQAYGLKAGDVVVVMLVKATPAASEAGAAHAPTAPAAAQAAPAGAAAAGAASGPAAASAPGQQTYATDASALVSGPAMGATVQQLCDMGFARPDVERCLRAAFNNPARAVEYLTSGLPEGLEVPAAAAAPALSPSGRRRPAPPSPACRLAGNGRRRLAPPGRIRSPAGAGRRGPVPPGATRSPTGSCSLKPTPPCRGPSRDFPAGGGMAPASTLNELGGSAGAPRRRRCSSGPAPTPTATGG